MMAEWIRSSLDIILIFLVGAGLVQATRLIWHLTGLRVGRVEMERFVREFHATVLRAETGIKNLKLAARESGDDLEKLVEKSVMVRDELQFIVESADQLAERLTNAASAVSGVARTDTKSPETKKPEMKMPAPTPTAAPAAAQVTSASVVSTPPETKSEPVSRKPSPVTPLATHREPESGPASRAEKELMQALKKLN